MRVPEEEQILELAEFNLQKIPRFLHKYFVFEEEVIKKRWDECSMCEFLTDQNVCKKCLCIMKIKIRVAKMSCPVGKWDKCQ